MKNILNFQKPASWIRVVALLFCIGVALCFLTNPKNSPTPEAAIARALGLAENDITVFGTYETWEDGWYILGFLADRSEARSDLGAALFRREGDQYSLESYYRCKDGAISQDRIVVCSFSKTPSKYDVILSNNENLARIQRTVNGVADSSYVGGTIPGMTVLRCPDDQYSSAEFQFYDQSGRQIDDYVASNTVLNRGEYEPKGIVSLALWSSATPGYFLESAVGTTFGIYPERFQVSITDATRAAFVGNVLYENSQYITADVGDRIEIMSSRGENGPEPLTMDVSSYSPRLCYQVLTADGTDTGYRVFRMGGETWIGHWGLYGTAQNGWWCEYIFRVNPSGAGSLGSAILKFAVSGMDSSR
ncbi:hypothetical protein [Desulfitobacterium chlororespirans]|uniref:Uncharacterized protein n=1 Tax=Desulfitobacterium chlororespirans DSM 11544 TaxID=1121395 RepID=A0A1M7UZ46_9FIRM|nr:hypothetical protein [Desulfitobacterium chlororespirans]SHN88205.1 hypothetical protein SAMN02745215_05210 [Desulfitobacterium chlororespirans DSM 11544]